MVDNWQMSWAMMADGLRGSGQRYESYDGMIFGTQRRVALGWHDPISNILCFSECFGYSLADVE